MKQAILVLLAMVGVAPFLSTAYAEEGMWTFNNFPAAKVKQAYGFAPTKAWLDHVRLSSARLAQGCSASFVSPNGLLMTNHHCAQACLSQLSTKERDYFTNGFYAPEMADEKKCPNLEANQLVDISDVTARLTAAGKGLSGEALTKARDAEQDQITKACQTSDDIRCEVVSLYNGGVYNLYKYQRYQDLRLVFAPEFAMAFFGGDPDNFNFPRYDIDLTFLRVYSGGQPLATKDYFPWSPDGSKEGDLTFVSGNPGSTERLLSMAAQAQLRDYVYPRILLDFSEYRGLLTQFQQRGEAQKRASNNDLFGVENSIKSIRGEWEALLDPEFSGKLAKQEREFRARVAAHPAWNAKYGSLWNLEAKTLAIAKEQGLYMGPVVDLAVRATANARFTRSELLRDAIMLNRLARERIKPSAERLPGYGDADLPGLRQLLLNDAPINKELEIEKLTYALTKYREDLGADDPRVKTLLGKQAPRDIATSVITATHLDEAATRKKLFEEGQAAIASAHDPLLELGAIAEQISREVLNRSRQEIEPVLTRTSEGIAKARFEVYGTSIYPDATFTLRLSYGSVKGYREKGHAVAPYTIIGGAFERATGAEPFALPQTWLDAKSKLDLTTPMNFVTTNDIIGGNSGSPVINQKAQIIGLVFDGNIQSLGGAFGFDESVNRTVAVDSRAILEALRKVYKAERLLNELSSASAAAASSH